MPCQQCENGKWKWGSTGECSYDSKSACEAANHGEHAEAFGGLPRIASRVFNVPLMIARHQLEALMSYLGPRMDVDVPGLKSFYGASALQKQRSYEVMEGSGIIPITGELIHRGSWMEAMSGLTSYQTLEKQFIDAAEDPEVKSIIMDLASPGGEASAVFDLADLIYNIAKEKPVYAVVNESAYSAAYALASAATKIYVPRTGGVGSIGVIAQHVDQSQYNEKVGLVVTSIFAGDKKNDFSPHKPLSDRGFETLQNMVSDTYDLFVSTVARNRGVTEDVIRGTKAGIFMGKSATKAGLADVVMPSADAFREIFALNRKEKTMSDEKQKAETKAAETKASSENVIDFEARLKTESEKAVLEARKAEQLRAKTITETCNLAGFPHLAGSMIAEGKTAEECRELLMGHKASQSESYDIDGHVSGTPKADNYGWSDIFAKTNEVFKK